MKEYMAEWTKDWVSLADEDAGFALNKQVAQRILGWEPVQEAEGDETSWILYDQRGNRVGYTYNTNPDSCWDDLPDFSGNIEWAWEVVEYLFREKELTISIDMNTVQIGNNPKSAWYAVYFSVFKSDEYFHASDHPLPLAICRAALAKPCVRIREQVDG